MTVIRTLVVGLLFLVALGLLGYLFVLHPEGPRLLTKIGSPLERPGASPPSNQPGGPAVQEESMNRPDTPADPRAPARASRSVRHDPAAADSARQARPSVAGRAAVPSQIPEERVRPQLPRTEDIQPRTAPEPYWAASSSATGRVPGGSFESLSSEDIERIVEKRKAIQLRLGGG